jgi:hypothetical protein
MQVRISRLRISCYLTDAIQIRVAVRSSCLVFSVQSLQRAPPEVCLSPPLVTDALHGRSPRTSAMPITFASGFERFPGGQPHRHDTV